MANISLDAIDAINFKLSQAYAIVTLLIGDCDSDMPINDRLRSDTLSAISDLIGDSHEIFKAETENESVDGVNHD